MRLRTVSCNDPGWRRVRRGRGFSYLDETGTPLADDDVRRVRALVIPPAWQDVWICSLPHGHLQAVGTDEAGRRQYLYHPQWRIQRDIEKFERVQEMAARLPRMRRILRRRLALEEGAELERSHLRAAAVRLIDLGYFRVGAETYAAENGSYGLSTLERQHVHRVGDGFAFAFVGKSGVEHDVRIQDPALRPVLDRLLRARRSGQVLLAAKTGGRWRPLTGEEINEEVRDLLGTEATAKDFRTWHATVTVARELGGRKIPGVTARRRAVVAALDTAAEALGNTRAVARSSYVDPRVLDLFEEGRLPEIPRGQARGEQEVLRALGRRDPRSPAG